jgi:hypothetical protein
MISIMDDGNLLAFHNGDGNLSVFHNHDGNLSVFHNHDGNHSDVTSLNFWSSQLDLKSDTGHELNTHARRRSLGRLARVLKAYVFECLSVVRMPKS